MVRTVDGSKLEAIRARPLRLRRHDSDGPIALIHTEGRGKRALLARPEPAGLPAPGVDWLATTGDGGMTDHSERGRFIWHELRTPNPAGACDFYAKVIGWKTESSDPDSSSTFMGPMGPLGGCSPQSPTAVPRWIPFVTVGDVEETLSSAQALGAGVVVEPTALESGGRYAVLTDPQAAAIGIYSAEDFGPDRAPELLEFSWHELATTDFRSAFDFYRELFGWENVSEFDMGSMGVYLIFGRGEKQLGGMFNKPDAGQSGEPAWISYVRVADLGGTVEKLKAAHGSLLVEPMEVPGGDWIAQVLDPHGAAFALHTASADVKARNSDSDESRAGAAAQAGAEQSPSSDGIVTEVWTADAPSPASARKAPKKKAAQKKAANDSDTANEAAKSTSTKKAAKTKTTAKRASKAGTKKSAKKKAAKKKTAKKKAGKKAAKASRKKAAKKTAKKAGKKSAKKTSAKTSGAKKAAGRKAARKTSKKAAKKTGKKAAKKKAAKKKAGKKKAGKKKASKKKAAKRSGGKKKPSKQSRSGAAKKPGKRSGSSRKAARKKAGKKTKRKSR